MVDKLLKLRENLRRYFLFILILAFFLDTLLSINKPNYVAVIKIEEPIFKCSNFYENCFDSSMFKELIDKAKNYKAILLELSCPGGEFYEVYKIIKIIQKLKKNIYVYIPSYAFSGCYWIAVYGKYIVADKYALVGSIGVKSELFNFAGLLKKLGIKYYDISYGEYKSAGDSFRNLTKKELDYLRNITYGFYQIFLKEVEIHRKIKNQSIINEIKKSKIYFASEAKKLKLIDYIGDKDFVKKLIERDLNETIKFKEIEIKRENDWIKDLLYNMYNSFKSLIYSFSKPIFVS